VALCHAGNYDVAILESMMSITDNVCLNFQNQEGITGLMAASVQGHTKIVRLLLQYKKQCDINVQVRVTCAFGVILQNVLVFCVFASSSLSLCHIHVMHIQEAVRHQRSGSCYMRV
jgi:ankyrin repeat protein